MITLVAFKGQKAERSFAIHDAIFAWITENVRHYGTVRRTEIYSAPGLSTKVGDRVHMDAPMLAEVIRGLFHVAFTEETCYKALNAMGIAPPRDGRNTNPNLDNRPNLERLTQRVYAPGGQP